MENLSIQTQNLQEYIKKNPNPYDISESNIKLKYQELIDCIIDHNHLYYIESTPIISDIEYDHLFDYLKKIEEYYPFLISSDSPTQGLVWQIQEWFKKAKHKIPMLSLENSYNAEDMREWEERIKRILNKKGITKRNYIIEPKFDGLSIEIIYENWNFKQAITRWDGIMWEDVTKNVKTIKNLPKRINTTWITSFRGEIVIRKSELEKINKERQSKWLVIYANTRNLASWSLKQLDPSITASRKLECYLYDVIYSEVDLNIKELELPVFNLDIETHNINNIDEIIKICEDNKTKEYLNNQDIEFDGLVIKVQEHNIREEIGSTAHHPRWAIAYKFPAQQITTQIKSVDFQVGRTGIITPVANLETVELSGAKISRVSLHNFDFIKDKDIHHNDWVWLQRSGEVIPYIVGVIKEKRSENSQQITPPTHCPSCNTELTNIDIHYYCTNKECPAQIKEKIIWFVSKECMNIEWIWESIVDILVEHGIVKNIADLYKLLDFETERVVRRFPWFADKKVTEIKKQLEESKKKEFWRLLNGLGISGIGKKTAKDISQAIVEKDPSCNKLESVNKYLTDTEFLDGIYGIWSKLVEQIIKYFNTNQELLKTLEKLWLNYNPNGSNSTEPTDIKWTFSITGSFPFSRPEVTKEMENNGYKFDSNPIQSTQYMLVWDKPGSKLTKAEEMGVEIIKWWDNILKKFNFLKDMKKEEKKPKWPEQMWLF